MSSYRVRRERYKRWLSSMLGDLWAWRNWINRGFRKASEIDFGEPQIKTSRGVIMCCQSDSPKIARKKAEIIDQMFRLSKEDPPLFVSPRNFKKVLEVENG